MLIICVISTGFITSAKEDVFSSVSVCMFICQLDYYTWNTEPMGSNNGEGTIRPREEFITSWFNRCSNIFEIYEVSCSGFEL